MSIADKITQLTSIRAAIRTALQSKGVSAVAHNFDDFANDILAIPTAGNIQSSKRVSAKVTGPTYVTPDTGYDGLAQVIVNMITRQAKTVTPSAANQTVSPDSGYQGLSEVTVEGDPDLVPGNIKNGVDIFGVTGNYSGGTPSLQSKSVNPSTSQQVVTPDSGYDGLSQVTVAAARLQTRTVTPTAADQQIEKTSTSYYGLLRVNVSGDENLVASNIKKDVSIFGVTGTYEGSGGTTNGSLIEITCSSNIDEVTATVNGHTYTANLDTTTHKAYVTIPYTDTTAARTCTLRGYANGSQATSATVSMAKGIGYYTATLSTSAYLFNGGTYYGINSPSWAFSTPSYVSSITDNYNIVVSFNHYVNGNLTLSPSFDMRGYSKVEVELTASGGAYNGCTTGSYVKVSNSAGEAQSSIEAGVSSKQTITVPLSTAMLGNDVNLSFHIVGGRTTTTGIDLTFTIHSIKLV